MKKLLAPLALAAALIVAPSAASAVQIEPADTKVSIRKLTYAEPWETGRLAYVEINDGSTYRLRPCRLEDSNHCYWDASSRGNGVGRDFVALGGRAIYVQASHRNRIVWP